MRNVYGEVNNSPNCQRTMYMIKNKYPNLLTFIRLASDPDFVGLGVADVDGDGKVLEGDVAWLAVAAVVLDFTVLDIVEEEVATEVAAAGASLEVAAAPPEESPPDAASFVGFLHDPNAA